MLKPNAAIMADNPLSKIPTLVLADGRTLFDSVVICEYLDDLAGGSLFPKSGDARWQALRWHAFGDGLLDALILWRNEREREVPLQALLDAFELKTRASLERLDEEAEALAQAPFSIGHVTLGCALGYLDYRFEALGWRALAPRLAAWQAQVGQARIVPCHGARRWLSRDPRLRPRARCPSAAPSSSSAPAPWAAASPRWRLRPAIR